jgi:hypothetical protein
MIEGEFCISILTFFLFCWWEINAGPFFMGLITVAHVTISKRIKPRGPQSCPEFTLILCCLVNWTIAAFHQKKKKKKDNCSFPSCQFWPTGPHSPPTYIVEYYYHYCYFSAWSWNHWWYLILQCELWQIK